MRRAMSSRAQLTRLPRIPLPTSYSERCLLIDVNRLAEVRFRAVLKKIKNSSQGPALATFSSRNSDPPCNFGLRRLVLESAQPGPWRALGKPFGFRNKRQHFTSFSSVFVTYSKNETLSHVKAIFRPEIRIRGSTLPWDRPDNAFPSSAFWLQSTIKNLAPFLT